MMVDSLLDAQGDEAVTALRITADNFFLGEDGRLEETGLVEHIAQSASALAGSLALEAGATEPPLGMIGEVKKFHCYHRPAIGDVLITHISLGTEVEGVRIVQGRTSSNNLIVAETQLKIYIKKNR